MYTYLYTYADTFLKMLIEIKYLSVVKYCSADHVCVIQYYPNMICILLIYVCSCVFVLDEVPVVQIHYENFVIIIFE